MDQFAQRRHVMVAEQLRDRGITDERVLAAMAAVPRERFVGRSIRAHAYEDRALPIEEEQTISQPWVVAAICEALALTGGERVLEIGTGSGYSAAVLARVGASVLGVERFPALGALARERLEALGVDNVEVIVADGTREVPGSERFDAIAVHAAAPAVPPPLLSRLADGGRLVMPIAEGSADMLTLFTHVGSRLEQRPIAACRFVPLVAGEIV